MNPDGYSRVFPFIKTTEKCLDEYTEEGRYNDNQVDLNRNFPDYFPFNNNTKIQKETEAIIELVRTTHFVLNISFHGGSKVVNYPFDDSLIKCTSDKCDSSLTAFPDNNIFQMLAQTYSFYHLTLKKGEQCPNDRRRFPNGITNGNEWYPLCGGMQDYNYIHGGCFEITVELDCCKFPSKNRLKSLWNENYPALITYLSKAHVGIKGIVTEIDEKTPIQNAFVYVNSNKVFKVKTTKNGEFWRLLLPGRYFINVYEKSTIN